MNPTTNHHEEDDVSTERPVLGIDLGTMTLAAGYAIPGHDPEPLTMQVRGTNAPHYRSEILVSDTGEVRRPDFRGKVASRIGNLTAYLGRPPMVVAGAPYGINTLIEMLVGPAVDAADDLGTRPDTIAAVVPAHWPEYTVDQYCKALNSTGLYAVPVGSFEAMASYAELEDTDGLVTCINVGAQDASFTIAVPDGSTRFPEAWSATTTGGLNYLAQHLVIHITAQIAPTFQPGGQWLRQSTEVGQRIIRAAQKASSPQALIAVNVPAPVGKINVRAGQVNDLVEDLMRNALTDLTSDQKIHDLWGDDQEAGIPKTLLVTGGLSTNTAVGNAIRTTIGPWRAKNHPEALLAMGAARHVAEGRTR